MSAGFPPLPVLLRDTARLLAFQRPSAALHTHWQGFLAFGLACTWLAGIGRYWDNPRADWWQYLGLGSLAYVFALALLLWLLLYPFRPLNWRYRNLLVFISLTAPPAWLYAIPVERFASMQAAASANAWFLALVAAWRVALLVRFLHRVAGLRPLELVVATALPLTLIVVALALLNLEHVVFNIMAGIRPEDHSVNDLAYQVVFVLAALSFYAFPFVLLGWVILAGAAWWGQPQRGPHGQGGRAPERADSA